MAIPYFFLFAVFMNYYFHFDLGIFSIIEEFLASMDKGSVFPVSAVLLVGLPLLATAINILAILHLTIDPVHKELIATIKLRWKNITLIVLSLVSLFVLYAVVENIHHSLRGTGL